MLIGALAPAVSRWQAASLGIVWTEICSIDGVRQVALQFDTQDRNDDHGITGGACGYCLLQQHSPFIPARHVAWSPPAVPVDGLSLGILHAPPLGRLVRVAHLTRAPPVFS